VNTSQPIKDAHVLFPDDRNTIGTCPRCGSQVVEGPKGFSCANRDCRFSLWKDNRFFTSKRKVLTAAIAAVLLKEGRVPVKGLYSEKTRKTYDATVVLDDTGDQYVNFKLEF
ncbi:MAG: DNA topoisomerase III, partial [Clostridia bacterium]|nr:DNA topoisomerase III [Clostridia bacterium]